MYRCCVIILYVQDWTGYSQVINFIYLANAGVSVADREASLELIKLDISRTFPSLYIFQKVRVSNQL